METEQETQPDVPSVEQKKKKLPSGNSMWAGLGIFVVAVIAVLVYASQTELDGVTLALLLFVLFFGEIFVALQWYSTSRQNSRASAKRTLMNELEEKLGDFTSKHKGLFSSLTTTDKELKASVESLDKTTKYIVSRLDDIAAGRVQMELTSLEIEQIANRSAEKISALPVLNKPQKKDDGSAVAKVVTGAVVAEISSKLENLENTQKEILKRLAELETTVANNVASNEDVEEEEPEEEEVAENADEPELEEVPEEPEDEDASSQEDEAPEIEEELPKEESESEDVSEEDVEEEPEIDEILKEDEEDEEDVQENESGEDEASEDETTEEEESTEETPPDSSEEEFSLVEDLPHTALILTLKLSKGQKPFLRGNAPGLSETRSTPMEYSGNNRWRFDFDAMREDADITLFLDDTNEKLGDFKLQAGKVTQLTFSPEK